WKRYRGGTASRLWLDPTGDGEGWRRLLEEHEAGVYSPIWVGDRLAFCSDLDARLPGSADGQAQLYSVAADGSNLRCH
ncbi:hypothetical protein, partial [Salmonella enterica]|uniref:hypothetical protein n=1 Tax=Salmonella enterica TaxID=28901 RepID=UPI0032B44C3C